MIRKTLILVLFAIYFLADVSGTKVNSCDGPGAPSRSLTDDKPSVIISGCTEPPCILKKKTTVSVEQHFVAPKDIKSLTTTVSADVLGINLPFIGVSGTNACGLITHPDGSKAGCPLVAGKEYIYKNSFPVLSIYPTLPVKVHWSLTDKDEMITCFQVPSRITS